METTTRFTNEERILFDQIEAHVAANELQEAADKLYWLQRADQRITQTKRYVAIMTLDKIGDFLASDWREPTEKEKVAFDAAMRK